ncbi:MAG: PhoH family protein [Coriobacteriia bacterium]|nr:PhoH family protein [Coriobacteriia bacterium]MCL2870693.1 PhoH family protein [Coriobacteriia bacterium]
MGRTTIILINTDTNQASKPFEEVFNLPESINPVELLGQRDEHLRLINRAFEAQTTVRGNEITIMGAESDCAVVHDLFADLIALLQAKESLDRATVERYIDVLVHSDLRPSHLSSDAIATYRGRAVRAKTLGQKAYLETVRSNSITFGIGPAGTGKTYLAMALAVEALKAKQVKRLILTRPAVEAGENLGFLPGSLVEKVDPYLRPLYDALLDMMEPERSTGLLETGVIEIAPIAFMRGRTLNDAFIIVDEAQNTTSSQMKMLLTRLGFNSKMVVTGDATQIDLPRGQSGLADVESILTGVKGVGFSYFSGKDVVRHKLVQRIVEAYRIHEGGEQLQLSVTEEEKS